MPSAAAARTSRLPYSEDPTPIPVFATPAVQTLIALRQKRYDRIDQKEPLSLADLAANISRDLHVRCMILLDSHGSCQYSFFGLGIPYSIFAKQESRKRQIIGSAEIRNGIFHILEISAQIGNEMEQAQAAIQKALIQLIVQIIR